MEKYNFKSLNSLSDGYKTLRNFAWGAIVLSCIVCTVAVVAFFFFAQKEREKIYVLDQGKSLMLALSQDAKANRPVEAREHLKRFHTFFYTLSPDVKAIESNLSKAIKMGDGSVSRLYQDLADKSYYNSIISGGVSQRIEIEKIDIDFNSHPYYAKTYAVQYITRKGVTTERNLVTECYLRESIRSDDNPQGFLIERYRVVDNSNRIKESALGTTKIEEYITQ